MPVLLIGTLDTKGVEFQFVRDLLRSAEVDCLVMDAGVLQPPLFAPDIPREQVYAAAGTSIDVIRAAGDRGKAISAAARGVSVITQRLHSEGKLEGVLGLGGSAGTTIATSAMRALPFGMPKMMVSTMASGQVRPYVGVRDVCMMYSVVDLSGLNRISRTVLRNAAFGLVGMVKGSRELRYPTVDTVDRPLVTATMFGVTTPCVEAARALVEQAGYEVLVFHATGTGGQTMEAFIRDGLIAGVLDVTTTELADEQVGGDLSAGPDRLTAAALRGVPAGDLVGSARHGELRPARVGAGAVSRPALLPAQPDRDARCAPRRKRTITSARRSRSRPAPPKDPRRYSSPYAECPLWIAKGSRSGGPRPTGRCSTACGCG